MKLNKFIVLCTLIFMFSGCALEDGSLDYSENGVEIYSQMQGDKKLYRNTNEGFEIFCDEDWEIVTDVEGYLSKFVFDTGNGEVWLGIKKEKLETENQDINSLLDKYANLLKAGIVKSSNVTIDGKKGKWIKVEAIDGSGLVLKNEKGENVEVDKSNLVTNDENEPREDIIFISDDKFAYVFLFHADNLNIYQNFEQQIDLILTSFRFIEENAE